MENKEGMRVLLLLLMAAASLAASMNHLHSDKDNKIDKYEPNWDSLELRKLPAWYDEAKIGIFVHWGVYAVPSYTSEWFWYYWKSDPPKDEEKKKQIEAFMQNNYKPNFSYQDFAKDFTAEFFDAKFWAELFENSGAKYVVLTSKHHEGFALWPSKYSYSWNSVDVGPHRDIVGELRNALLERGSLRFGLYHSLYEWFHPLYLADKAAQFTTKNFVNYKVYLEMKELVNTYEPEIFWSDGEAEAPSEYWRSQEFLAWLYNESPVRDTVVVNDRWGTGTLCHHGGMYTCQDRYNPGVLQKHKWENAMTLDKTTWGFNRASNLDSYLTPQDIIDQIVSTVSCGGNILINVGPCKDGTISPIFQHSLREMGKWLKVNGEAIYGTVPWNTCQNDTATPDVWYTANKNGEDIYAIMLRWPKSGVLRLECAHLYSDSVVTMVGLPDNELKTSSKDGVLQIQLPDKAVAPSDLGSVLKITSVREMETL